MAPGRHQGINGFTTLTANIIQTVGIDLKFTAAEIIHSTGSIMIVVCIRVV